MMKNLYTIIMDFEGGTYIDQVYSNTVESAINTWKDNMDFDSIHIKSLTSKEKKNFFNDMDDYDTSYPVLLDGMESIWHFGPPNIGNKLLCLNIVLTCQQNKEENLTN